MKIKITSIIGCYKFRDLFSYIIREDDNQIKDYTDHNTLKIFERFRLESLCKVANQKKRISSLIFWLKNETHETTSHKQRVSFSLNYLLSIE